MAVAGLPEADGGAVGVGEGSPSARRGAGRSDVHGRDEDFGAERLRLRHRGISVEDTDVRVPVGGPVTPGVGVAIAATSRPCRLATRYLSSPGEACSRTPTRRSRRRTRPPPRDRAVPCRSDTGPRVGTRCGRGSRRRSCRHHDPEEVVISWPVPRAGPDVQPLICGQENDPLARSVPRSSMRVNVSPSPATSAGTREACRRRRSSCTCRTPDRASRHPCCHRRSRSEHASK